MSNQSDMVKLELINKYIRDLLIIIGRHGSVEKTLTDIEGVYAIMMCITQIGETVNRISNPDIISKIPTHGIIGMRNRIIHGYEDIDLRIMSEVIKVHIPKLKITVESMLGYADEHVE